MHEVYRTLGGPGLRDRPGRDGMFDFWQRLRAGRHPDECRAPLGWVARPDCSDAIARHPGAERIRPCREPGGWGLWLPDLA